MQATFEQLITEINISSACTDVLQQLTLIFKQHVEQSLPVFVTQVNESLVRLEHKIWKILTESSNDWFHQPYCLKLFETLALFNKNLIFEQDDIKDEIKISLLLPESIELINTIFDRIEKTDDDNHPFITCANYWFENLSYLVHEYPQLKQIPIIVHINEYIGQNFLLSRKFQFYLSQLRQIQLSPTIFTSKQLFYMKTCPLSLNAYFYTNPTIFNCNVEQILKHMTDGYLQMIQVQSSTVEFWSKELLACITHLIGFMRAFLWWDGGQGIKIKDLFSTEKVLCEYIQALFRIIEYEPFYKLLMRQWYNDETILMDSVLLFLMNIIHTHNINWFFRSIVQLPNVLLELAETPVYFRIYLCTYGILSEVLTEEHLKELKIADSIKILFFNMLEQAWQNPAKKFKQIPISYFLKGFLNLSKNDFIQEGTAKSKKILLFIDMSDQYPTVFDIIWALSFNRDIQQQLLSNSTFIEKLNHLSKQSDDEQIRKATTGILWNLQINQQRHPTTDDISPKDTFDFMISYSHKDKVLCKQLYDELIRRNYRVWIDFDQMHGNVMDAMAQAIDRSQTIIICMSEQYRKSNFCRAEAHYAFQRQRQIVPVLMQKHYKPDGWLLFLIGQLLYVDFTKYDFDRAMEMLMKELRANDNHETNITLVPSKKETTIVTSIPIISSSVRVPSTAAKPHLMLEWTQIQVQQWLIDHQLVQLSRLLNDYDGRSLIHLYKYVKHGQSSVVLSLLQEDSIRRLNESVSLVELSRFQSLMHQQKYNQSATNSEQKDKVDVVSSTNENIPKK